MAPTDLAEAMDRLQLDGSELTDPIDEILFQQQSPSKRRKESPDEIKARLEHEYLTPSPTFSTAWLDKLQQ